MLSYLIGKFIDSVSGKVIIEVNGVGYGCFMVESDQSKLVKYRETEVYIYTHVRDDILDLYGFLKKEQLELFEMLLSVSGVGPKSALLVINKGVEPARQAISKADVEFFTTIPRLGKKSAQRIIIDLKSKIGSLKELELRGDSGETREALDALMVLGFSRAEAIKALQKIPEEMITIEQKIGYALKKMGSEKIKAKKAR